MQPKFFQGTQDRMEILKMVLNDLGNPDEAFKIIHIIGTNGKGSTARMTASLLESLGFSVGLFTSPHIDTIYERIQVDGENISDEEYQLCRGLVRDSVESTAKIKFDDMTWFDAFFLTAMLYFARKKVDYVVMEAGIGGIIDSTNGVKNVEYTIFTKIGMDHNALLGQTIDAISEVKLGAMRDGTTVILAPKQREVVKNKFIIYSKERHASMLFAEDLFLERHGKFVVTELQGKNFKFSTHLYADYQLENMKTALTFLVDFCAKNKLEITEDLLNRSLGQLKIKGRFETIYNRPRIILDGAHNADGIHAFTEYVRENFKEYEKYIFTGFVDDKDLNTILTELLSLNARFYFTTPRTDRAVSAGKLNKIANSLGKKEIQITEDAIVKIMELVEEKRDEKIVIFIVGSLYLITDLRKNLIEHLK